MLVADKVLPYCSYLDAAKVVLLLIEKLLLSKPMLGVSPKPPTWGRLRPPNPCSRW